MKQRWSLIAFLLIAAIAIQQRLHYPAGKQEIKLTTWDAFGYYMYLPATLIYNDNTQLKWLPAADGQYSLTGGQLYQAGKCPNGNYVYKYLGGVAILQSPFFLAGHLAAKQYGYAADGFSKPYQSAIAVAALFYLMLGLWVLRKVLLLYFSDGITAVTLLLLSLATNLLQYAAVDSGMSHIYIFPLYALALYTTICWHRAPTVLWAGLTGLLIGLATICRPTEAVMLFLPLLWDTHTKAAAKAKWRLVTAHKRHIAIAVLGGIIGILPQLLYWKATTGHFIYDVGSKWDFLQPHFRVLLGWEKGWFIYTPVTLFFMAGLFFLKGFPFRRAVLWFCGLNLWIIMAWSDWRYGGSYSARALVQSYLVFALPLAALVQWIVQYKARWLFYAAGIYLIAVNLFQIGQYNKAILHFNDMNRRYYARIYLNPHPTPADMSVLDSNDVLDNENGYRRQVLLQQNSATQIQFAAGAMHVAGNMWLIDTDSSRRNSVKNDSWLKIESTITVRNGIGYSHLQATLESNSATIQHKVRLETAITQAGKANNYVFFVALPDAFRKSRLEVAIAGSAAFSGIINKLRVTLLEK